MTSDPLRRQAARAATFVALPVAVLVAAISLWVSGVFSGTPAPTSTPSPSTAVTSAVKVETRKLTPDAAEVCRGIVAKLPTSLLGSPRRPVTAGAEQNAAYGEPPVILACGVTAVSVPPTDLVSNLSGVCWHTSQFPGSVRYTTVDREVPVSITVPGAIEGSAQSVIPFSAAIKAGDTALKTAPTGCTS